jgi:DNA modification methylase
MEQTPEEFVGKLLAVFAEVRRVLRDDGTLWLNLGDSYATGSGKGRNDTQNKGNRGTETRDSVAPNRMPIEGLKTKDLVGIPCRVAFALQADGWFLRQDIIWYKPNVMPESVTDRFTKAHEHVFLLAKSERYFFDAEAVAESQAEYERTRRLREQQNGMATRFALARDREHGQVKAGQNGCARSVKARHDLAEKGTRNRRSVWLITNVPGDGNHFAAMPSELAMVCILAGCPLGGTVLDPFGGSGTTGYVSEMNGRNSVLIELNPKYVELAKRRTEQGGLFCG